MFLPKHIPFLIIQLFCCAFCFAQREQIDSLKKVLPWLKDSARVDCLNALSEAYIKLNIDTSEIFDLQALKEAENIHYIHGIAESTSLKATIVFNKYSNYAEAVNLALKAIFLYTKTSNKKRLNRTYYELGHALYAQSYFEEAIHNFNISYDLSKKVHDSLYIFYSILNSAYVYQESGNYKKAFEKAIDLHQFLSHNNNRRWKSSELIFICDLYSCIEDFNNAINYRRQSLQLIKPDYGDYNDIARLFSLNHQFDSAKYYFSLLDTSSDQRALRFYLVSTGEYYFLQGHYNKALHNFLRGLSYNRGVNDRNLVMHTLVNIAKTYDSLHNYTFAYSYTHEALALARQTGARQFIRDCYQMLYSIYNHWKQADSALFYHEQYAAIKDSIISEQVGAKLVAYDFNRKIEVLNNEKEVQLTLLRKESFIKKLLITGILVLLVLAAIVFRYIILKRKNEANKRELAENELRIQKLESEKKEDALKQQATELEMQALRAQMNPHFIFNSLNSINRFILKKQSSEATEYLTKFSRLIRMILNSSASASVSLVEDLEALQLYLELENLRFDNKFIYKVACSPDVDADFIHVPPMLLQPFVENAIWHGLMNKESEGHVWINIDQEDSTLICTITDDGIGRQRAAALKVRSGNHKSMGMSITKSRIDLMNKMDGENKSLEIKDLVDADGNAAGTEIIIKIPVSYD